MYLSALSSRLRVWLAPILALALVAGGLIVGSAPAQAATAPSISVTPNSFLDPSVANTLTVSGSGFVGDGAANGAYVLFGEKSVWSGGSALPSDGWISQAWVQKSQIVDGAFTTTISVPAGKLDPAKSYQVATSAAHGLSITDRSLDAFAPVSVNQPANPKVTVSKTTGLNPDGDTVTVKGSGFFPTANTVGARPPLAGKFTGAYVVFGKFADTWQPSANAPGSARSVSAQKWAVPAESMATIGGAGAGAVEIKPDGTFEATLSVKKGYANEPATGNYGIYTYPGGGAKEALFETATPISFQTPTPQPTVTVSKTTGLNPAGETITVTGTGFTPTDETVGSRPPLAGKFTGTYVVFGKFADTWQPSAGAPSSARVSGATKWAVPAESMQVIGGANAGAIELKPDGSFSADILVKPGFDKEPATGNFGIYTYAAGGSVEAAFETATPITFAAPTASPKVTVSKTTGLNPDGDTVTVTGTGFLPTANTVGTRPPLAGKFTGAYVVFGKFADTWQPSANAPGTSRSVSTQKWAVPAESVETIGGAGSGAIELKADGSFEATLSVKSGYANEPATGNYGIYTYGGGGAKEPLFETATPITFAPVVQPANPTLTITPNTAVDPKVSNTFTVTGTGYTGAGAANGAYVLIGAKSNWAAGTPLPATGWLAQGFVPAGQITDGKFTTTLTVAADAFAAGTDYAVFTSAAHGLSATDRSLDAQAAIALKPVDVTKPSLTITPNKDVDPAKNNTFTVSGTGFVGPGAVNGAYVLIGSKSNWAAGTPLPADGWLAQDFVTPARIKDGAFTTTIVIPSGQFVSGGEYAVFSSAAHGLSATDRSLDAQAAISIKSVVIIDPTKPSIVVTPSADVNASVDNVFTVTGSAFTGPGAQFGAYILLGEKGLWAGNSPLPTDGWLAQEWVKPTDIVGGKFTVSIRVPAGTLNSAKTYEVASSAAHGLSQTDRSLDAFATIAMRSGTGNGGVEPTKPPVDQPAVTNPVASITGGSLRWSIKNQFSDYVQGPIAKGSVSTVGGVTRANGAFQFGQAAVSDFNRATGTGSVSYSGGVRFYGHGGVLDYTLSNPTIQVLSPTSATLTASLNGNRIVFGTLNLGAATRTENGAATTWSGVPVQVSAAGGELFQGRYPSADPLTFTIGSPAAAPLGVTGTVLSVSAKDKKTALPIPATPPATTGLNITETELAKLGTGESATVTASGFQPGEKDIRVVVYSTPILLGTIAADANGNASWTGALPATLEAGEHTLTFQGSVNRGVVFTLAERALAEGCAVEGATLNWGFKASFLNYIEGIARGEYTAADGATFTYPEFAFTAGTGSVDGEKQRGLVTFAGTMHFTGHQGVLDTTLANPQIELVDDKTAYVLLDVHGTTQDGQAIDQKQVRFAQLDLSKTPLTRGATGLNGDKVPATLTAEGAAAFGTYPAGEALDAVTFSIPLGADCGVKVEAKPEAAKPVAAKPAVTTAEAPADNSWIFWTAGGLLALIVIATASTIVVVRRRRLAEAGE
ncbi:HtaA domain-containing protein [Mycetocola saprophilus]|uniref:HtaA domain-containing protein n=1 Tax=Mycetocola saprophilus TaxID=76636 RepID=UPI003BEF614A